MMRRLLLLSLLCSLRVAGNPLLAGADPHVEAIDGKFWLYPTESGARGIFAAYSSPDLRQWQRERPILDLADVSWIKDDGAPAHHAWAPAVAVKGGKIYFYYSVGPQHPTPSRIGVAVGDAPGGPFKDIGKPLLTGDKGFEAIDPMVFIDPADGRAWLYAGGSAAATLRVYELGDDLVSLKREAAIQQPPQFTEGAFMHSRGGIYYLSYSHGRWNDASYSVHYATAPSPSGPWTYRGAILSSDDRYQGPGHHSFVRDPATGGWFIVYHRWETTEKTGPFRGRRMLAIEPVSYDPAGLIQPIVMTGRER